MASMYNSQPGRKQAVRPHRINPYRGLWQEAADVDLDAAFGITEED